jgi:stage II sporulation protein D
MKREILKFLFIICIVLCTQPAQAIKIGLYTDANSIQISASSDAQVIDVKTNRQACYIKKMTMYEVIPFGTNGLIIRSNTDEFIINSEDVVLKPTDTIGCVFTKDNWYRGILKIQNKSKKLTVINDVCIEHYIQGVLPSEMPTSWNKEALKAQAIAARTYAIANYGKHSSKGFDLTDTKMDQVYNGIKDETEATNRAVLETSGIIMTYNEKPINAMYSSSAGGQTRSAQQVYGNNIPYLQSVPSFDDDTKKNGHGVGMSQHGAKNLAIMGNNAYQILSHFYNNIQFMRLNPIYYK